MCVYECTVCVCVLSKQTVHLQTQMLRKRFFALLSAVTAMLVGLSLPSYRPYMCTHILAVIPDEIVHW